MSAAPRGLAWVATVAIATLIGCDAGGRAGTQGPGGRGGGGGRAGAAVTVEDRTHLPRVPAAASYGERPEHELNPAERAMLGGLEGVRVRHDPALSRMGRELALAAPDRFNMPPRLVDGLLAWFGLFDPPPSVVVVEVPQLDCASAPVGPCGAALEALVQEVRRTVPEGDSVAVGVGASRIEGGGTRMLVAYIERGAVMRPVPVAAGMGETFELRGRLLDGRRSPRIEVVDAEGMSHELPVVVASDGSFRAGVTCSFGRGVYQIELLAEGRYGPEVVANFPVTCGARRPDAVAYQIERLAPGATAEQVARENLRHLNDERERRGLPALKWSAAAAEVARLHSEDMVANRFVGHVSPTAGDVSARFARAGLSTVVLRENVARGYGPRGIHLSLMHSPGHRVNILAEDVSSVGIGVVVAPPETDAPDAARPIFLTQNFYRAAGEGVPDDLAGDLRQRITDLRARKGLSALAFDAKLAELAQAQADALARARPLAEGVEARVFALGFESLERHQVSANDHLGLPTLDLWLIPADRRAWGIGVARIERGDRKGEFVMVVFVADRG